MTEDVIRLLRDGLSELRSETAVLQGEVSAARREIAGIEARHIALENWRSRFELQVTAAQDRFIARSEELVKELSRYHADFAQFRGEQAGSRRTAMMVIGVLSAALGGLVSHLFNLV